MKSSRNLGLSDQYEKACNEYLLEFCAQMELSNEGWVGNDVGGVAYVGDYFIGMSDLMVAVDNGIDLDALLEWYDYGVIVGSGAPNLKSWLAGCPRKSQEELDSIEATRKRIMELEDELKEMMK